MKKIGLAFCIIVMLLACVACAEENDILDRLKGSEWSFSSGVGGWSTDMRLQEDGAFSGEYHDSEMNETGEGYPDGTLYGCSFTGRLSVSKQVDDSTWRISIDELTPEEGRPAEEIDGGIRYVTAEPYGIQAGDTLTLYAPGTSVSELNEDMLFWAHAQTNQLETWFMANDTNESGFVGYEAEVGLANPWTELTAEELRDKTGLSFGIPRGAENIAYRLLDGARLMEMQFTLEGDEYCARIQPADEYTDISGMYFEWDGEEEIPVGRCRGTLGRVQTGSVDWIVRFMWYDSEPGLMYSISAYTVNPDGLDLKAVAEQVYIPVQG